MDPGERRRPADLLRVGELAGRSGLTVRTLHHYDQIGLLTPAARSAAGYRLYDAGDVERLTRILLLKHLGLSLDEIRELLDGDEDGGLLLGRTLALQVERLRETIARQTRLLRRLETLAARLDSGTDTERSDEDGSGPASGSRGPSVEDLTETLELLTAVEPHFTAAQLDTLGRRRETLGGETIRAAEAEWPELIAAVRAAMDRGADPAAPEVQRLAERWKELVEQFTGGDPAMARSVRSVYRHEPAVARKTGLDPEILEFIARANAAAREG